MLEGNQVCSRDQPPFSAGSLLARRRVTVPQFVETNSTFMPSLVSTSLDDGGTNDRFVRAAAVGFVGRPAQLIQNFRFTVLESARVN